MYKPAKSESCSDAVPVLERQVEARRTACATVLWKGPQAINFLLSCGSSVPRMEAYKLDPLYMNQSIQGPVLQQFNDDPHLEYRVTSKVTVSFLRP